MWLAPSVYGVNRAGYSYLTNEETEAHEGSSGLSKSTQQSWAGTGAYAPGPVLFPMCVPICLLGRRQAVKTLLSLRIPHRLPSPVLCLGQEAFWWPRGPRSTSPALSMFAAALITARSAPPRPAPRGTQTPAPPTPREEQVPFSKEERPFSPSRGLQRLCRRPGGEALPLGVPDAGMKPS